MDENFTNNIIAKIKERRNELGMSYQDLADATGITKSTIQRYETGYIKKVPVDQIAIIAKGLHVSPGYLMGWDDSCFPVLTHRESSLLTDYRNLNSDGQGIIDSTARGLTNNPQYATKTQEVPTQIQEAPTEEDPYAFFEDRSIPMAASGLTSTSELSEHNKAVIAKYYTKDKTKKKG